MSDFIDRLTLLITANSNSAVNVVKGFGTTTQTELSKVEGAASATGGSAGTAFGQTFSDKALLGIAAFQATVGGFAVLSFGKSVEEDAVALARTNAELSAELKTTGASAGVASAGIDHLAGSIQKSDAIYSGTVKSAAALLLTLRDIQNQAGAGNDVFNRTLSVSASIANVFGKDLPTAALQVGKAIENPVSGVQQLQRAGIALNTTLRDQINALAKSGDLLGAQKALLSELETRYTAAGAAIAKADPFQQLSVQAKEFKTQVGQDVLPEVTAGLHVLGDTLDGLRAAPPGLRGVTEGFLAFAAVAIPLAKVKTVLDSIQGATAAVNTSLAASSATGGAAAATAIEAEGNAALGTAADVSELDGVLAYLTETESTVTSTSAELQAALEYLGASAEQIQVAMAGAAVGVSELGVAQAGTTAALSTAPLIEEDAGLGLSLGAVAGGIGAVVVAASLLAHAQDVVGGFTGASSKNFKELTTDAGGLVKSIDLVQSSFTDRLAHIGSTIQGEKDLSGLVEGFKQLGDQQGPALAFKQLQDLEAQYIATGGSAENFALALKPAYEYLHVLFGAERDAAQATGDLNDAFTVFQGSLGNLEDTYSIADAFDAVSKAQDKVKSDYQDIAGTSDAAITATRNVQDAFKGVGDAERAVVDAHQHLQDAIVSVTDAQDSYTQSTHNLAQAQQALAQFESPRGALERQLQLDSINRRVSTTPAEYDQKRLDLLKFQDDNANKQQSLQDAVTSANKGVRDSLRQISDAQRSVIDAQSKIVDATTGVQTAEEKLAEAVKKRQELSDKAKTAIVEDERSVQEAIAKTVDAIGTAAAKHELLNSQIDSYSRKLKTVTGQYAPGSELDRDVTSFFNKLLLLEKAAANPTGTKPPDKRPALPVTPGTGQTADFGGISITGFADGGFVPGPRGRALLAKVHAGELILNPDQQAAARRSDGTVVHIEQTNHFGSDGISSPQDLSWANAQLAWNVARLGRGS